MWSIFSSDKIHLMYFKSQFKFIESGLIRPDPLSIKKNLNTILMKINCLFFECTVTKTF